MSIHCFVSSLHLWRKWILQVHLWETRLLNLIYDTYVQVNVLLPFAPPPRDCGSSRSNFLIWLQCLLWWWTFKLSKSFVKYCLSTKSVKCVKPQSPLPVSTVPLFESTCLTVKSWCKRVTRPAMVERTLPLTPSTPSSPTCTRKKQQQKWLAEPNTASDVFYKHKFFR